MGLKERKRGQGAPKSAVVLEPRPRPRAGCPDEVVVVGGAALDASMVGERVSLTLADDRAQVVVGGRVAPIWECRPDLGRVTRCLEEGETYLGTVSRILPDRFEATLTRAG